MKGKKNSGICFDYQKGKCTRAVCKFSHDLTPSTPQKVTIMESPLQSHVETPSSMLKGPLDSSKESSPQSAISHEAAEVRELIRELARTTNEQMTKMSNEVRDEMRKTSNEVRKLARTVNQLTRYNSNRDKDVEFQVRCCVRKALEIAKPHEMSERTFLYNDGKKAVEWDGIFLVEEPRIELYVVEVKQHLTEEDVDDIQHRIEVTRRCLTDTTPNLNRDPDIRCRIAAQRAIISGTEFNIRAIVGGKNVAAELKSLITSKGYIALFPNGDNWSISEILI